MRTHHPMFQHLIAQCRDLEPVTVAVAFPCDEVSLLGALEAAQQGLIAPTLVGPRTQIFGTAKALGQDVAACRIIDADCAEAAAVQAVALCRKAECAALMKGSLHTDVLMHEVTKADTGLRGARRLSHVYVMDVPSYSKLLLITDAAINIYPSLEEKVDIVQNAIDLAHVLGIEQPKVAILSAVETVTPKISSTIEAAALCKMAERGQIQGGILDGPLAFDNAVSIRAARIKHIVSPVAGHADILVVPDLESGNMLAKQLEYLADAEAAGVVLGARVPIVLTSRADSAKARLASCAVMALLVHASRKLEIARPADGDDR
ncbi:MAG TPA: bifunctional enoyl-CoA hydratase/phosphate acetyltransferase [Burkholderiaceae bacterium]|jgi:phosphate acetyltransferase|nr:bifunctional enoyl-CoA hydratase/phosphate acetyltransferase [Burkholderiaceae bacterium]